MRGCKLSDKEIAGIVKCSELGLNQYQTAKILDVSQATISRSASKYGIKFENWRDQTCDKCGVNYCKQTNRPNLQQQLEEIHALGRMIQKGIEEMQQ
mgnify:CR=1 FL=1